MFVEGTCPKCHEKIQVPDDREQIICMYCGEEIRVKEALGIKRETDRAVCEENLIKAKAGLKTLMDECRNPMQDFKREKYKDVFEAFYADRRDLFTAMEQAYLNAEDQEVVLAGFAEDLTEAADENVKKLKFKGSRGQRQLDFNFLVSVYLIPAALKFEGEFPDPFADCLIRVWNDRFQTTIGKATYEDIEKGFKRKLCYITTAICEGLGKPADCRELQLLKDYRDRYMEKTPEGHAMVEEYYDIAPTIVKRMSREPDRLEVYRKLYQDYLVPCLGDIEAEQYEACQEKYRHMVMDLRSRYMN